MKKLGIQITAFREERFIIPVIKQFEGLVDDVVVTVSHTPWYGDLKSDNTFEKAKTTKADVYIGAWESEALQRNFAMKKLKGCDYVLVCHADTFFTKEYIQNLIDWIQTADESQYDILSYMYWKDFDTVVVPNLLLKAMLIRQDVRFKHSIIIEDMRVDAPILANVICHHLSWVKTDKEVQAKLNSYSHANEISKDWYEEVWKKNVTENFAPTVPHDYTGIRKYKLPEEIRRLFI